jgi:hypothetical protein
MSNRARGRLRDREHGAGADTGIDVCGWSDAAPPRRVRGGRAASILGILSALASARRAELGLRRHDAFGRHTAASMIDQ